MATKYVQVTCPHQAQVLLHAGLLLYYWNGEYGTCMRGYSSSLLSDEGELANLTDNMRERRFYVLVEEDEQE